MGGTLISPKAEAILVDAGWRRRFGLLVCLVLVSGVLLVDDEPSVRAALKERIDALPWMSAETKKQAQRKLAAFNVKIGYPDKWKDYSSLSISRASYLENVGNARTFETKRNLAKLGKPIDRTEWNMTPPTVNAYYSSTMNEIVFPAGILQPPFFSEDADDAVNYGGIGVVIGHEMSHGFDDSGSQYDADGNLKNWWTAEDRKAYDARTVLVVRQFDGYRPLPDLAINGKLTLGENIGDLGGIKIAYAALQKALEGRPRTSIDGFTPEQRFFLGWGKTDGYSPADAFLPRDLSDPFSDERLPTDSVVYASHPTAGGTVVKYDGAIRYKGNSTRYYPKKGHQVKFNTDFASPTMAGKSFRETFDPSKEYDPRRWLLKNNHIFFGRRVSLFAYGGRDG